MQPLIDRVTVESSLDKSFTEYDTSSDYDTLVTENKTDDDDDSYNEVTSTNTKEILAPSFSLVYVEEAYYHGVIQENFLQQPHFEVNLLNLLAFPDDHKLLLKDCIGITDTSN